IDAVVVLSVLALVAVAGASPRGRVWAALGAALIAGPWWIYQVAQFGTIVPSSGEAVRVQVAEHRAHYLTSLGQLGWALGAVFEPWVARLADVRLLFYRQTWLTAVLAPAAFAGAMAWLWRSALVREVRAYIAGALFLFPFYALYVPALWFFPRYLAPVHAAVALLVAIGLARARYGAAPRLGVWSPARVGRLLASAVVALSCAVDVGYLFSHPARSTDEDLHGAKGYREAALAVLDMSPRGAVLGALQSGALSYFADGRDVRVLNLDGVVDAEAKTAFQGNHMASFARARAMTHFADWTWNRDAFIHHAGDATMSTACFVPLGSAPTQPPDRFVLYAYCGAAVSQPVTRARSDKAME
ncbi:MAG TPA: hypothetical protein VNO21_02645, partial [Polyangiaceae bacterium]|nr:hypothetical protein [Polyangiaceae bacterium]